MVNYENGKIYKLYSPSKNIVYIGSTAEKYLSRRLQHHLTDYKIYKNTTRKYTTSFKVLDCEDYKIELLEEVSCNNVEQLRERERYYIENNDCVNKKVPNRNKKEYYQVNKEHIKEYHKNYNQNNKEHKKEYHKNYRDNNKITCECGCEITKWYLRQHTKTNKHLELIKNKIDL